ncbi:MAG: hypothetical protein VW933_04300 [Flavobacteriaceae bacterium]
MHSSPAGSLGTSIVGFVNTVTAMPVAAPAIGFTVGLPFVNKQFRST